MNKQEEYVAYKKSLKQLIANLFKHRHKGQRFRKGVRSTIKSFRYYDARQGIGFQRFLGRELEQAAEAKRKKATQS